MMWLKKKRKQNPNCDTRKKTCTPHTRLYRNCYADASSSLKPVAARTISTNFDQQVILINHCT